jgi:uncharacterized protein
MSHSFWLKAFVIFVTGVVCMELLFYQKPVVTHYHVESSQIPEQFHEFTILHISDLHNASFGHQQELLVNIIEMISPSIIVFTGDLIERRYDVNTQGLVLMEHLTRRYPVYFVTGNHEESMPNALYEQLLVDLQDNKVTLLNDKAIVLTKENSQLLLMGLRDALATNPANYASMLEQMRQECGQDLFSLLLTHRPEFFKQYVSAEVDLVFSGHTHGGQIRIPWFGGIYAPNQGFFPTYMQGEYQQDRTTMFVNRGLGATVLPFRLCNPPDISVVHLLHCDDRD